MIRFVDIRNQGTGSRFAFFVTNTNKFFDIDGEQVWGDLEELKQDCFNNTDLFERLSGLCPDWVMNGKDDDIIGWYDGDYDNPEFMYRGYVKI